MKEQEDPLALVRESRLRISREQDHDPTRVIVALRQEEGKYATQIEQYRLRHTRVAEDLASYGSTGSGVTSRVDGKGGAT